MRILYLILSVLCFSSIAQAQFPQRLKAQSAALDTIYSNRPGTVYLQDSLAISGYAQVNNIEAKSGDMVAIRDTARTSSKMGIGSITGTIDSALTVFSGADYGGIHARGGVFSGGLSALTGTFSSTVTLSGTGANVSLGSNFISNGGTDAGLSFDVGDNATFSGTATVEGFLVVEPYVNDNGYVYIKSSAGSGTSELQFWGGSNPYWTFFLHGTDDNDLVLQSFLGSNTEFLRADISDKRITLASDIDLNLQKITASRLVASDASKNLVSTITLANLASSVSDVTGTTGTNKFVLDTSPTLVTPNIGAATGTSLTLSGDLAVNGDDITSDGDLDISAGSADNATFKTDSSFVQQTRIIRKAINKTGIADNTATTLFRITNTDGANDGGTYSVNVAASVSIQATAATTNSGIKRYEGAFVRAMETSGTGVNSAVLAISETASAATTSATRDIGTITMTVVETSEFLQDVQFQVDATGSGLGGTSIQITCIVELIYTGFTTAPTITSQ